jgi:hypothetical protein
MPRKSRVPKLRASALPLAVKYWFMCGATAPSQLAPVRLPGWPTWFELGPADFRALWHAHRAALTHEARIFGFEPIAAQWFAAGAPEEFDDVTDSDPARAAWSRRFCDEHGY